jgi:hypothetical protein
MRAVDAADRVRGVLSFFPRRAGRELPPVDVPSEERVALARVALYTRSGRILGAVESDVGGQLNRLEAIPIWDAVFQAQDPRYDGADGGWSRVPTSAIVLAVPLAAPPLAGRVQLRPQGVGMHLDRFRVTGLLHTRPGVGVHQHLATVRQPLVPLTRVEVFFDGAPEFNRLLPLVLVNVHHLVELDRALLSA